jgi:hypothetical protein
VACIAAACGVLSPEQQLLTDFFEASRLNDTTVMAKLSAMPLNPGANGIVDAFEIERKDDLGSEAERVQVTARVRSLNGDTTSRRFVFTISHRDSRWYIENWKLVDGT